MRLTSILALAGLTSAWVVPPHQETSVSDRPGRFSVKQVPNPNYVPCGPLVLAKAYNKYHVPIPEELRAAVKHVREGFVKRSNGSVETRPGDHGGDREFLTPVSIGTPGKIFNLDLDTGSADMWVYSSLMPENQVTEQTIYDPDESSTAKELDGYTWRITYGDGSRSSGIVYKDVVTIGGLKVKNQSIGAALKVSESFTKDGENDGLVGLSFGTLSTVSPQQQMTLFENLLDDLDGPLSSPLTCGQAPVTGHYNFGYIDSEAYVGSISWVPVNDRRGWWEFLIPGYRVGDGSVEATDLWGIADTGTTLLLLPKNIVKDYYRKVPGSSWHLWYGGYVVPCDVEIPNFSMAIGDSGFMIEIPGDYIKYQKLSRGYCYGGIQSSGQDDAIIGDVMLKSAFVVFDAGLKRLGWAKKKELNFPKSQDD